MFCLCYRFLEDIFLFSTTFQENPLISLVTQLYRIDVDALTAWKIVVGKYRIFSPLLGIYRTLYTHFHHHTHQPCQLLTDDNSREKSSEYSEDHDRPQILEKVSFMQIVSTFKDNWRKDKQEKSCWRKSFFLFPTVVL